MSNKRSFSDRSRWSFSFSRLTF